MDIRETFLEYKSITIETIKLLKQDEDIDSLMKKRDVLLKSIFENEVDKEKVKNIYNELKIKDVDNTLKESIKKEQEKVKEEIKEIHTRKRANNTYGNHLNGMHFLNKQI